jgi:hypothetical protein
VESALFKRGCVRIVGEHATAKSPRERALAFSMAGLGMDLVHVFRT